MEKNKNLSFLHKHFFTETIMSLSRNVIPDKMSVCHEGHQGTTYCNAVQAGSVNYHCEVYHWWRSNTVDGGKLI